MLYEIPLHNSYKFKLKRLTRKQESVSQIANLVQSAISPDTNASVFVSCVLSESKMSRYFVF